MLHIGCYHVFDLECPSIYGQFLGFLQHRVVGDILTQNKCANCINSVSCTWPMSKNIVFVKNIVKQLPHGPVPFIKNKVYPFVNML